MADDLLFLAISNLLGKFKVEPSPGDIWANNFEKLMMPTLVMYVTCFV
jgi:hypothetical protein